jgi:hypothetical protein
MHLDRTLPRYVRKSDLARAFGVDARRKIFQTLRPIAILVEGEREFELFEANIPVSFAVNSAAKKATPQL